MKKKQLVGRMLQIASGTAQMSIANVQIYRERWAAEGYELPPLQSRSVTRPKPVQHLSTVGTKLHEIIKRETGVEVPCPVCAAEIEALNTMTREDAAGERERVVDGIVGRAPKHATTWGDRLKLLADKAIQTATLGTVSPARHVIGGWFDEAIQSSKDVIREVTPVKKQRGRAVARNERAPFGRIRNSPALTDPAPAFTAEPELSLMFHVWPRGDQWRRHVEMLAPVLLRFRRKLLGIATDRTTATAQEVRDTFGNGWEVTEVENNLSKQMCLREVATYQKMLPTLTAGVNEVTFCAHAKGAQDHTIGSDAIRWWTDAMYETVLYNISGVIEAMKNGAAVVGSFQRFGPMLSATFKHHFSGTFYAFRNCVAFRNGVPTYRQRWWGTESWPGDHFPRSASHCIFGANAGDLYKVAQQPRPALELWRSKNGNVLAKV